MIDPTKLRALSRDLLLGQKLVHFLGLFLPEDSIGDWDLVVSAKGIHNEPESYAKLASLLDRHLSAEERLRISRIAIISPEDDALAQFRKALRRGSDILELQNVQFGGTHIRKAIILLHGVEGHPLTMTYRPAAKHKLSARKE